MIKKTMTGRIRVTGNRRCDEFVQVTLRFDKKEPLHVGILFVEESAAWNSIEWVVARDLLLAGLHSQDAVGHGDFRVMQSPNGGRNGFCVRNNEGHADVEVPHADLEEFLRLTSEECPLNSLDEERAIADDLDSFLESVFAAGDEEGAA